jgi:hypothetical protein
MRNSPSAAVWVLLGGVAALSCSSGGGSGPGTGGSGGSSAGSAGATGTAGNGSGGTSAGSGGAAGSTGGSAAGSSGSAGSGGATGGSSAGSAGNGGSAAGAGGSGTGGSAGGGTAGAGGRGGSAGAGTAGAGGGSAGAGGRGGGTAGNGGSGTGGAGGRGGAAGSGTGGGGGTTCSAGHAISLSSNGSASVPDTAQARVEVDLGSDLPIGNTQRTIEFWAFISTSDWVGEKNEVYYYGTGADGASFGLDFGTNPVMNMNNNHATMNPFTGSNSFTVDSTADLGINSSTNQWVHIAMVWNGTNVITYVNGAPKITASGTNGATMLATGQSVLTIGCNPSNMNCFNGLFDEFRVWKVARTATEIQSNYNKQVPPNTANLVGYWKFDEASGATAADAVNSAGHTAHNGTLKEATGSPAPTFVVPTAPLPLVCN